MIAPEISLAAALRDIDSEQARYREQAARNLAPALLEELGKPGPRWRATAEHPRGDAVLRALTDLLDDEVTPPMRGQAAVALGTLGEPPVLDAVESWLTLMGDDEDRVYLRQCALISLSFLGRAAAEADSAPQLRERINELIAEALRSPAPDLRFQAAVALVELQGDAAESTLVAALRDEENEEVQEGLLEAIAYLDPPSAETCDVLESILEGEDGDRGLGFRAAMTLAAARRVSARPRLLSGLVRRHERDDALEALAALGPADAAEIELVHRMVRRVFMPGITRVRAAYALARMVPSGEGLNPGVAILERLRWHPRAAVREAVRDAFANLERLGAEESEASSSQSG